jgi:hypothetical protein
VTLRPKQVDVLLDGDLFSFAREELEALPSGELGA